MTREQGMARRVTEPGQGEASRADLAQIYGKARVRHDKLRLGWDRAGLSLG